MSEIKKNIETCRGEDVLAEVSALPQDPHFGSLVNEALDPLKQQAAAQEGWDGYSEVIAQHKPYTFASAIIQMKSNLLLLLRALWQFPFGTGTLRSLSDDASLRSLSDGASLRSLSDMWQHYITRLSGNETYGIPSRLSSLTDLPSAPLLLADRKISGADVPDGTSIAQLLFNTEMWNAITEIVDDNIGWIYDRPITLPNSLDKLVLGMGVVRRTTSGSSLSFNGTKFAVPHLTLIDHSATNNNVCFSIPNVEDVDAHNLTELQQHYSTAGSTLGQIFSGTNIKKIDTNLAKFQYGWNVDYYVFCPSPVLQYLKIGNPTNFQQTIFYYQGAYTVPNRGEQKTFGDLIHLEFGEGTAISLNLSPWNPTNALDASLDTLVTDEDCHNNLEQFLKNFRTYIALRLATFDSNGPTLTLSQAVYDAIKDESHLFVFDEGTMTIYAYLTNIKHWTVTK